MSVAAIVLAAGASRRLGQPKQLISIRGQSLIEVIVDQVRAARCDEVGVVLGSRAAEIAPVLAGRHVTLVLTTAWEEGIAAAIRAGVQWAAQHDAVVICVCDQPHLRTLHVDTLISAHLMTGRTVASRYAGILGVPAVFGRASFPSLVALQGDAGARSVISSDAVVINWPLGAYDLDEPADLDAFQTS